MRRFINVQQLAVGTSPDHEGVVIKLNPAQPDEITFTLTPESAIKISAVMHEDATKLLQEGKSKKQARPRTAESHSITIVRERGEKLDS